MAGSVGGSGDEPEFQVAPMIDVLLVILIFFMMITSAQVLKVDKTIELPVAKNGSKVDQTRGTAYINIRWHPETKKSEVVFEDKVYPDVSKITPILNARHAQDPKYRAIIRGDRNLPAGMVSGVMDICGQAGLTDVSFSAINRD